MPRTAWLRWIRRSIIGHRGKSLFESIELPLRCMLEAPIKQLDVYIVQYLSMSYSSTLRFPRKEDVYLSCERYLQLYAWTASSSSRLVAQGGSFCIGLCAKVSKCLAVLLSWEVQMSCPYGQISLQGAARPLACKATSSSFLIPS